MKKTQFLPLLIMGATAIAPLAEAYSPGDLMILGLDSDTPDRFSFVTWVEIPANDSILFFDAEFGATTLGDGTGEGAGGGIYDSLNELEWTNTTGSPIAAGTVIEITDLSNGSASINSAFGSVTGGFALTSTGEQIFIADGSMVASGGDHYLDGTLIFGFDYEDDANGGGWGEAGESALPSALNVADGNLSFLHSDYLEYDDTRTGLSIASYKSEVLNSSNWATSNSGSPAFDLTAFSIGAEPTYSPGDLMFVGWNGNDPDTLSFVTWVDIPNGESFLFIDAEYDGGGDGTGVGTGGGSYAGLATMTWTNNEGVDLPAGTVVVVSDMSNGASTANVGTTTGGFAITNQGEQFFIAQGSFNGSNFEGELIFGVDFENGAAWDEPDKSKLPSVLNVSNGNLAVGKQEAYEYAGTRNGSPIGDYAALVLNTSNWQVIASDLSGESFIETVTPPVVVPDELGEVNEGLLFHARRMNNKQPILDEAWSLAQGASSGNSDNLNGASCIRLPADFPSGQRVHSSAEYYLYFADHSGTYIRMAWAADLEGPWTGYRMDQGTYASGDRGVLDLGSDGSIDLGTYSVEDHIASPQVLIERDDSDPQNPDFQFVMYYHGRRDDPSTGAQRTFVATSSDGLNFNQPSGGDSRAGQAGHGTRDFSHGDSYFRVFEEGGRYYAFSNTGDLFAVDENSPNDLLSSSWTKGPQPFINETESRGWIGWEDPPNSQTIGDLRPRHFGVLKRDGVLYTFLTNKASSPERIIVSTFDFGELPSGTNDSWLDWKGDFPSQELIEPEEDWEGGDQPLGISRLGSADDVRQLRDPGILEDIDGRTYMFYSGEGEEAIGVAQLVSRPVISGETEVTTGADHTYSVSTDIDVTPSMRKISKTSPIALAFGAEDDEPQELIYVGPAFDHEQTTTVNDGAKSYRLAHNADGDSATLTFPETYYATPGSTFEFNSRMGISTTGQFANLQISFDGATWQTIWIQQGGTEDALFARVDVDMAGMEGRVFQMRFRYIHEELRNPSAETGINLRRGWFFDQVVATGLETVTDIIDEPFTAGSFTLDEITPILDPHLTVEAGGDEDRFLVQVEGLHSGTGFSESIGYGKPFVIRVRDSYEDFLAENFTPDGNGQYPINSGEDENPDGDSLNNLLEFAFGTDPTVSDSIPLNAAGPSAGTPTISVTYGPLDFSAQFVMRKDAALTYTAQFSDDLTHWEDNVSAPTLVTPLSADHDIVEVPYPIVLSNGEKGRFFRVKVESD